MDAKELLEKIKEEFRKRFKEKKVLAITSRYKVMLLK